jgi:RNA polymerase sigma-70 factor (ECF subfamily)
MELVHVPTTTRTAERDPWVGTASTEGTQEAWNGLGELRPVLRSFLARRCACPSEIDDVIQETLIRAARYRDSLSDRTRLRGWTVRIAANVLADQLRRRASRERRQAEAPPEFEELPSSQHAPAEVGEYVRLRLGGWEVEKDMALRYLGEEFLALGRDDRLVLGSFYSGAMSCRETAELCGISKQLVRVRLFRARRRLLKAMRRRLSFEGPRPAIMEEWK